MDRLSPPHVGAVMHQHVLKHIFVVLERLNCWRVTAFFRRIMDGAVLRTDAIAVAIANGLFEGVLQSGRRDMLGLFSLAHADGPTSHHYCLATDD